MKTKIFSVVAAVCLVGAFALATLGQDDQSLGQLLSQLDRTLLPDLQGWTRSSGMTWLWSRLMLPVLVRPSWLWPACLGIICAGGAATFRSGDAPRGQRRRS